jgi:hypothetical protein
MTHLINLINIVETKEESRTTMPIAPLFNGCKYHMTIIEMNIVTNKIKLLSFIITNLVGINNKVL